MSIGFPDSAERVFGVMVAPDRPGPLELVTMAKKAAVFGLGGGKEAPVAPRGVRPVLKVDRSGVKPVRKAEGSKDDCGPASMAGDRGPERNELEKELDHG